MKKLILALGLGLLTQPLSAQQPPALNAGMWLALANQAVPANNPLRNQHRYRASLRYTQDPELIHPKGLKRHSARRGYDFLFADRAREDIHIMVSDDDSKRFNVTLPTGEQVFFDAWSKEIISGIRLEQPIDLTRHRHQRRNPDVAYHGRNLMITVDQRSEAPRRTQAWGKTQFAEVRYPAKYDRACRLSPSLIWGQQPNPGDNDPRLTMLHATDASLFSTVEQLCGWDLSDLRLAATRVQHDFTLTAQSGSTE